MPDERIHISKMLDISDEDAAEVIKDVAALVTAHPRMSDVVSKLAAKYGKKAILAGMMLAKTFEANERVQDFGSEEYGCIPRPDFSEVEKAIQDSDQALSEVEACMNVLKDTIKEERGEDL